MCVFGPAIRACRKTIIDALVFSQALTVLAATVQGPIMARIVDAPEPGLGEIMMAAMGLSGALAIGTILAGILVAGVIFWIRSRAVVTRSDITRPNEPS